MEQNFLAHVGRAGIFSRGEWHTTYGGLSVGDSGAHWKKLRSNI